MKEMSEVGYKLGNELLQLYLIHQEYNFLIEY
jgi:hypothetical protein